MLILVIRRVGTLLVTLLLVTIISFLLLHLTPGDPAQVAAGPDADTATVEATREALGLNRPLVTQFGEFVGGVVRGDFGTSFVERRPVLSIIWERLPVTASLVMMSLLFAVLISGPIGVFTAIRRGTFGDRIGVLLSSLGVALPDFFLGLILVMVFALNLGIFNATGYIDFSSDPLGWAYHLVLPALTLGVAVAAELTRHIRASVSDVLELDYVRTARSKGLGNTSVIIKHASRNAALPVVTVFGNQIARLLGGTVIVEQIFNLPGLGQLIVQSVFNRDLPLILGMGLFIAVVVLLVNALIDLSYSWLNPQVRS